MDVRDHASLHAREPAAEDGERGLLRALGQDRVRTEGTELARDPKRQERVEREPVERARPHGSHEVEARIGRSGATTGAREHPHVELGREGVELLRERRGERERVTRAPDHEQPLLHATARRSSASMVVKTASSDRPSTDPAAASDSFARRASSAEEAPDRVGERRGVSRRDEQAVLAVMHDLGHTAHGRGDDRRADRQRLDDRVGEVLPGGRKQRGIAGTEQAQDPLARDAPEEADAPVEPELANTALERRALRPVAGDDEGHVRSASRGPAAPRRAPSAARGDPRRRARARRPRAPRAAARGRAWAGSRCRVRKNRDPLGIEPPAEGDVTEVPLGQKTCRAPLSAVFRDIRRKRVRTPPLSRWNSSSVPAYRPLRVARSNTSSETSFTTSGRRASRAPIAARRIMLVA